MQLESVGLRTAASGGSMTTAKTSFSSSAKSTATSALYLNWVASEGFDVDICRCVYIDVYKRTDGGVSLSTTIYICIYTVNTSAYQFIYIYTFIHLATIYTCEHIYIHIHIHTYICIYKYASPCITLVLLFSCRPL